MTWTAQIIHMRRTQLLLICRRVGARRFSSHFHIPVIVVVVIIIDPAAAFFLLPWWQIERGDLCQQFLNMLKDLYVWMFLGCMQLEAEPLIFEANESRKAWERTFLQLSKHSRASCAISVHGTLSPSSKVAFPPPARACSAIRR